MSLKDSEAVVLGSVRLGRCTHFSVFFVCFVAGSTKINRSMFVGSWIVRRPSECDRGFWIIEETGTKIHP
jgi:hypothetical protein